VRDQTRRGFLKLLARGAGAAALAGVAAPEVLEDLLAPRRTYVDFGRRKRLFLQDYWGWDRWKKTEDAGDTYRESLARGLGYDLDLQMHYKPAPITADDILKARDEFTLDPWRA